MYGDIIFHNTYTDTYFGVRIIQNLKSPNVCLLSWRGTHKCFLENFIVEYIYSSAHGILVVSQTSNFWYPPLRLAVNFFYPPYWVAL